MNRHLKLKKTRRKIRLAKLLICIGFKPVKVFKLLSISRATYYRHKNFC